MRTLRVTTAALLTVLLSGVMLLLAPSASAQSPCAPGQPLGRPPGQSPQQPGQPDGRPPQYPPGACQLQISKGSAARGETVAVSGSGFVAGESVRMTIAGQAVRTLVADPAGNIAGDITVPNDAPLGRTEIRASGGTQSLSAAFEVVAAPAADRGRATAAAGAVARTGTYIAATALAGLALLAVGAAMVIAARRRRFAAA